ncbi:hypothetical protein HYH03_010657 [Edaphochlamys debaryana]|uniref:Kinesin motor domain-containing protein n=1 Tax=Edaphochlamys debaryana TaxID=47281 RepID=A0A835Y4P7_9CHLO|nr:hypothetical protein HYH03_010657 [Edaphochlamys debaryana]|eukprot:KAG2490984.1 hypothetical protein HYH03_010657 [Edaphochlamys debaryana]
MATQPTATPMDTPRSLITTGGDAMGHNAGVRTEKVWVGVRIRPLLRHEVDAKETVAWRSQGTGTLVCQAEEKNVYQANTYQYDRVFSDTCNSDEVYAAAAQPMVRSAMEGYNCTLFAYGQTGSGKTTTMRAVMKQAAKDIFGHIARTQHRDFVLKMSAIEVYNEDVHDLLVDADTKLTIRDDKDKGPVVLDLKEEGIASEEDLVRMLKAVEGRRQVRETRMNQKSSRSHLVVRLYVESRPALSASDDEDDSLSGEDDSVSGDSARGSGGSSAPPVLSTINFVDLAGSERLTQASMTDDTDREKLRQKEASQINVSLLTLGKVIRALGKRGEHVPYRESNLTRILQPSLSGNSRMAIVCTLSPALGSVENSRAALHFANHAKAVTMRPVLNEVRDEQALIRKMEVEIAELRKKLSKMDRPERSSRHASKQLLAEKDAELRAKEEQMQKAMADRATLERKLNHMEKFIIRGGTGSPAPGIRRSFDDLDVLASMAPGLGGLAGTSRGGAAGGPGGSVGISLRASWNPSSMSPLERDWPSAGKPSRPVGLNSSMAPPNRLLLDYLLPPGVRDVVNRLGGEPTAPRAAGRPSASPAFGTKSAAPGFSLRSEIGKLQAPEGSKAQEALSALQAEVRCYSQQPAAAAAVAAAASATPDNADRLLEQLTQMLDSMERRQREGQAPALAATPGDAAGPSSQAASGADTTAVPTTPTHAADAEPAADAADATPAEGEAVPSGQAPAGEGEAVEDEAGLMALLRTEVARLQRLQAVNLQANQAIESLLGKVAQLEHTGGAAGVGGEAEVLERLASALEEAETVEEGDEDEVLEEEGPAGEAGQRGEGAAGAPAEALRRRRAPGRKSDAAEATSGQRYDSPAAGAPSVGPTRLTGTKLPRALAVDAETDVDAVAIKSPRTNLMASPHTAGAAVAAAAAAAASAGAVAAGDAAGSGGAAAAAAIVVAAGTGTPNSRRPGGGVSASVGAVHMHSNLQPRPESPRAANGAEADDLGLRRMHTPNLSMQASDGEPPSAGRTASVGSRGALMRWDTARAKKIISREKDAIHSWYAAEVSRLKAAFAQQAAADVESMREAVARYRTMFEETQERVERLNMQKQLLIKQVLQLELAADEADQKDARIAQLEAECKQAKYEAAQATSRAQAAQAQAQRAQVAVANLQRAAAEAQQQPALASEDQHAFLDDDDWAEPDTPEALLGQICDLWHKLYVPLVYRSRFFLLFRSKELIYLQMEQRRLKHRLEPMDRENDNFFARDKQLDKAKRALDLERKVLAQAVRHAFTDAEREHQYEFWGVKPNSKGKKLQLVRKLWEPANTRSEVGMEACANVVTTLAGRDATEQFTQLVFGNSAEASARPTHMGVLMTTLVRRVTTPRGRKSTTPNGGGAMPTASTATSYGNFTAATAAAGAGGVTPRRQSSLLSNLAGRVGSFMSRERDRDHNGARTPVGGAGPHPSPLGAGAAAGVSGHGPASSGGGPLGAGLAGPPGSATPRQVQGHAQAGTAPGLAQSLATGCAAAGGGAEGLGPMARGLAATAGGYVTPLASARGQAPPLPPPHPGPTPMGSGALGGGTPPSSARNRSTYVSGVSRP